MHARRPAVSQFILNPFARELEPCFVEEIAFSVGSGAPDEGRKLIQRDDGVAGGAVAESSGGISARSSAARAISAFWSGCFA